MLPVAIHKASSGLIADRLARCAITLKIPRGITPVPDGASLPIMMRSRALCSTHRLAASTMILGLPQWTISSAKSVSVTKRLASSRATAVGPPLICDTMSGAVWITISAVTVLLPGIEVPPVCIMTVMPHSLAHWTMGAASSGFFIDPNPISPTVRTPSLAISSKSFAVSPFSRITAPPTTLPPPGLKLAKDLAARIARALVPAGSFGLPGR